jgi:hypothetical protein
VINGMKGRPILPVGAPLTLEGGRRGRPMPRGRHA